MIIKNSFINYDKENVINTDNHHYYKSLDYLEEKYEYKKIERCDLIDFESLKNKIGEYDILNVISFCGVTDFLEIINNDKFDKNKIFLSFIIIDFHHSKRINNERIKVLKKSNYIFMSYAYFSNHYFPQFNKIVFFPHSIAYDIPFNEKPINKILVTGHMNKDIYPYRDIMIELSRSDNRIYHFKPDCNYRIESDKNQTYGKKYYELLNKYMVCFTDDLIPTRKYLVAKFFEICGSGSLLVTFNYNTKHIFEKLGYYDGIHYISLNNENYLEQINFIFDEINENEILKIRKNGYNLTKLKHTYIERAELMHNILNNKTEHKYTYDNDSKTKYISNVEI